jgi:hypothetical protein
MMPWRDDLQEIVEQGIAARAFRPLPSVESFSLRFCATLDGLAVLRLRQMPDLSSSELTVMAVRTARAELAPVSAASG